MKNRFYKNPEHDAAFSRCIDVMTRLIQKYGSAILEEVRKTDEQFALPHHKRTRNMKYLQKYYEMMRKSEIKTLTGGKTSDIMIMNKKTTRTNGQKGECI